MYNLKIFFHIFLFYVFLFNIIILLFYIEDFLIFIIIFESTLFLLLFISLQFIFNNKFILAVFYLIIFTVLSGIFCFLSLILIMLNNIYTSLLFFIELNIYNNWINSFIIWFFIFIIFGIKYPIFPFYFWLLSVHVEVSSEISIFLASIILKAGFIGIFKFLFLYLYQISIYFLNIFIIFLLIGIIFICYSVILFCDYKKIIGAWSIIHVNLSLIILWYNNSIFTLIFLFSNLSHIISSSSFFIIIGYVYENFNNKNIFIISSFFGFSLFSFIFILLLLNNLEFPFFLMFYLELNTFYAFSFISFYYLLFLIFVNLTMFVSSMFLYFLLNFYNIKWNNIYIRLDINIEDFIFLFLIIFYSCTLYWLLHFL